MAPWHLERDEICRASKASSKVQCFWPQSWPQSKHRGSKLSALRWTGTNFHPSIPLFKVLNQNCARFHVFHLIKSDLIWHQSHCKPLSALLFSEFCFPSPQMYAHLYMCTQRACQPIGPYRDSQMSLVSLCVSIRHECKEVCLQWLWRICSPVRVLVQRTQLPWHTVWLSTARCTFPSLPAPSAPAQLSAAPRKQKGNFAVCTSPLW